MKAEEARKLSIESAERGEASVAWLNAIYTKIEATAKTGARAISHPFSGLRMPQPSSHQRAAIIRQLAADGYKVKEHPGDQRESGYTSIEW